MDKKKLEQFKEILMKKKFHIMNEGILSQRDDLQVSSDDLPDEADLASSVIQQQVTINMRQREIRTLRLIDLALYRIDNGEFGVCEECAEQIEAKRLKSQPWAILCIEHAEELEREQRRSSVG